MNIEDSYYEDVITFKKIKSSEAEKLLSSKDKTFIYIGRVSCPYCRKFVKKLTCAADKTNTKIYYIDSENPADENIKSFRDKYNVLTVPGFLIRKDGEINVRCDSSISEEELADIIK